MKKYKFKPRFYVFFTILICTVVLLSLYKVDVVCGDGNIYRNITTPIYATEDQLETWKYEGKFNITHYCPCSKCCGQWADGYTYTGSIATANRTIAVDPDVIPLGSILKIDGQEYIAEDIGGSIKGNRLDIFCSSHEEALKKGVITRGVLVKVGEPNETIS